MAVHHLGPGTRYVEGWVVTDGCEPFVIEHGWCEVKGYVVDPSYVPFVSPSAPPVAYFAGLRFDAETAAAALCGQRLPIAWSRREAAYEQAFAAAWHYAGRRVPPALYARTRVVHYRREPFDVFISRPSKWAIPLPLTRGGSREQMIAEFRRWLLRRPGLLRDVWSLRGKTLGCDCAPLACHGDVLAELANCGDDPPDEALSQAG
jgi:Domain of unknown function (DUF4326)